MAGANVGIHCNGAAGVDGDQEIALENHGQGGCDEAADGECDEAV